MKAGTQRGLANYLDVLHHERSFAGFHSFVVAHRSELPHVSTMYRWHQRLGDHLTVFPAANLGALGLVHVHTFDEQYREHPFAVEAIPVWFGSPGWYVHLIVPRDSAAEYSGFSTDDPWQLFNARLLGGTHVREEATSPPPVFVDAAALQEWPIILPALLAWYGTRANLAGLWNRIATTCGTRVWEYLPRRRRRDGVTHLASALRAADRAGLFRQTVVRYEAQDNALIEIFVATDVVDGLPEWCEALRHICQRIEIYAGTGRSLLRITGDARAITTLVHLGIRGRVVVRDLTRSSTTSFRFDLLTSEVLHDKRRTTATHQEKTTTTRTTARASSACASTTVITWPTT